MTDTSDATSEEMLGVVLGSGARLHPRITEHLDCLVIGAGPAGLAAASRLADAHQDFLVVDTGAPASQRLRDQPHDIVQGVGGAGLFSDGKFSFFPSASRLWALSQRTLLRDAYDWLATQLSIHGAAVPSFPSDESITAGVELGADGLKEYESIYLSYDARSALIDQLTAIARDRVRSGWRVVSIRGESQGFLVYIDTAAGVRALRTRAILFCGGRFGPLELSRSFVELPTEYRRYEIGLRVDQPCEDFLFANHQSTDVKYITDGDDGSEWRTFCTVRRGEVVAGRWVNTDAYSGRADGPPTARSNFGLNLRYASSPPSSPILEEIQDIVAGRRSTFSVYALDFLEGSQTYLGIELDALFRARLRSIIPSALLSVTQLFGPTIEGVGYYPDIGEGLKVNSHPMWVAGDATGLFRGLTAALVSGHYAAAKAVAHLEASSRIPAFVKQSPSVHMTSIFTAQSKAYFYCRDAVCEYVFQHGLLPLNPFRTFGYFLNDRVDRDSVRRGNNQLIAMCEELWVFGPVSDGVLFEIVRARSLRKPIRYFSISTLARDIRPIPPTEVRFEPEVHAAQITREQLIALLLDELPTEITPAESSQLALELPL